MQNPASTLNALYQPWPSHIIGLAEGEPMFLTITDWNHDDSPDIFVPDLVNQLFHFAQTDRGWVCDSITYPSEAGTRGKSVVVGDINQNYSLDLITTYEGADHRHGVMLSTRTASGWQHYPISDTLGRKFDFARLVDMDQDGDLDVLTSEENNNSATQGGLGVVWYENPLK